MSIASVETLYPHILSYLSCSSRKQAITGLVQSLLAKQDSRLEEKMQSLAQRSSALAKDRLKQGIKGLIYPVPADLEASVERLSTKDKAYGVLAFELVELMATYLLQCSDEELFSFSWFSQTLASLPGGRGILSLLTLVPKIRSGEGIGCSHVARCIEENSVPKRLQKRFFQLCAFYAYRQERWQMYETMVRALNKVDPFKGNYRDEVDVFLSLGEYTRALSSLVPQEDAVQEYRRIHVLQGMVEERWNDVEELLHRGVQEALGLHDPVPLKRGRYLIEMFRLVYPFVYFLAKGEINEAKRMFEECLVQAQSSREQSGYEERDFTAGNLMVTRAHFLLQATHRLEFLAQFSSLPLLPQAVCDGHREIVADILEAPILQRAPMHGFDSSWVWDKERGEAVAIALLGGQEELAHTLVSHEKFSDDRWRIWAFHGILRRAREWTGVRKMVEVLLKEGGFPLTPNSLVNTLIKEDILRCGELDLRIWLEQLYETSYLR